MNDTATLAKPHALAVADTLDHRYAFVGCYQFSDIWTEPIRKTTRLILIQTAYSWKDGRTEYIPKQTDAFHGRTETTHGRSKSFGE